MPIEGGYILTPDMVAAWRSTEKGEAEYQDFVASGLFDPETGELYDTAEWMNDGNPNNGPFDFQLNPSHWTWGW